MSSGLASNVISALLFQVKYFLAVFNKLSMALGGKMDGVPPPK
jgi:hypothetical protein